MSSGRDDAAIDDGMHSHYQQHNDDHTRDLSMESNNNYTVYYQLGTDERHYLDKQIQHEIYDERRHRQEEELQKECPFRPHINENSMKLVHNKKYTALGDGDVSKRLLERAQIMEMERERAQEERRQREEQRLQAEAPFRPKIDQTSAKTSRRMFDSGEAVEDRLMEYGKKTKEALLKRQQLKEEHERLQQARAFNPRVNEDRRGSQESGKPKQKSFLTRALEKQNEKAMKLAEARAVEADQCTFKPSTNHISQRLDAERQAETTVNNEGGGSNSMRRASRTDQLYEDAQRMREHSQQRQRNRALEDSSHDFKPRVLQVSERIIKHGRNAQVFQEDFVKRQEEFQLMREEAHRRSAARIEQEQRHAAGQNDKTFVDEEQAQLKAEELYAKRRIKEQARRQLQRELQQEECPFKPQLSKGSTLLNEHRREQVGQQPGVVERLSATPRSRSAQPRTARHDDEMEDSMNASMQSTVSIRAVEDFLERQKESEARKAAKIQALQAEKELEEVTPCTFRPRIASNTQHAMIQRSRSHDPRTSIKHVGGVNNHVQRQQEARRKAEEKKQRVNNLGQGVPCNGPNYTVVMPFNLSSGRPDSNFRSPAMRENSSQQRQRATTNTSTANRSMNVSYQRLSSSKMPGARAAHQSRHHAASTYPHGEDYDGAAAGDVHPGYVDPLAANKLMEAVKKHTKRTVASNQPSIYA